MTVWPNGTRTQPDISSGGGFGEYPGHMGVDFINFDFNCAVMGGTVLIADDPASPQGNDAGGVEVRIRHDNGDVMRYLHNWWTLVPVGYLVSEGERIGVQGSSGTMTSGKHLHFEVWVGGDSNRRVDPIPYMQNLIASTAGSTPTPIERLIAMGVLSLHRVTNAAQAGQPWMVFNEMTLRATLIDDYAKGNFAAAGVPVGADMTTMQIDELDGFRTSIWDPKFLTAFGSAVEAESVAAALADDFRAIPRAVRDAIIKA